MLELSWIQGPVLSTVRCRCGLQQHWAVENLTYRGVAGAGVGGFVFVLVQTPPLLEVFFKYP